MDCGLIMKLQPAKRMSQGLERATRVSLDHSYECPAEVDEQQLKDLHIIVKE